jgi:2-methylisocitrate lyase-like PEP mutase family enzyme
MTPIQGELSEQFLALHHDDRPLLLPNAWDAGSARLFAWLGFRALATTSSGFAATQGLLDGGVSRDAALAHAELIANATSLPASADLENGFARDPDAVAETFRRAKESGLAGASIEDHDPETGKLYEIGLSADRVAAAAAVFHDDGASLVLTGRAENFFRGPKDLGDTITRLQAYQEAGADVLFAPGLVSLEDVRSLVSSVDRPVNVLARPGGPTIAELAEAGVARVSVGGSIAFAALATAMKAGRELLEEGTFSWFDQAGVGADAAWQAFAGATPAD